MKKIRPMGQVMLDLEPLLFELVESRKAGGHELQVQEVCAQIVAWAEVHYPSAIPEYIDGSKPVLKKINYGPKGSR